MESDDKTVLCWSGGKDCMLALGKLELDLGQYVRFLMTTVTEGYDRVSMHGVRRELLEDQSDALDMDLEFVTIPQNCSDLQYQQIMGAVVEDYLNRGITSIAFGDIYLEEVRKYREENLAKVGMRADFPLWGRITAELALEFIANGNLAIVTCVDTDQLSAEFAGRIYDDDFFMDLPERVDPCGENGEFHTFVYDGPMFWKTVSFKRGETVMRENRFCFYDLEVPVGI
jgi:uncharacterized protein (TIGR00290 family)